MHSFTEYKDLVENNLLNYIPNIDLHASKLRESMEYSLTCGGKRIRPVLLLAACDFAGGDLDLALPYACAIEYIHTYSLIHDDLPAMDNDDLRRGKPTNHKVFGEDIAILAGDALLNSAAEIITGEIIKHIENPVIAKNLAESGHYIMGSAGVSGMIGGQVADVLNQFKDCSAELVEYIEANKTGKLLTAPIYAGLTIANANDEIVSDFVKYAVNLGKAFQISDDILDFEGDAELLGKNVGKDKDLEKCNYVCVHGLGAAKDKLHELTITAKEAISKYAEKAAFFVELAEELEKRKA